MKVLIGILNVFIALNHFWQFFISQFGLVFYGLLGLLYLIAAWACFDQENAVRRAYLWAVIPVSMLGGLSLWTMGSSNMSEYFRMTSYEQCVNVYLHLVLPFALNVVYFMTPSVKKGFGKKGCNGDASIRDYSPEGTRSLPSLAP